MKPIIALAGMAEAGIYYSIILWRALVLISLAIGVWAHFRPSKKKIWGSVGIMAVVVAIVQPWADFVEQPVTSDDDVEYWRGQWREFSVMLIIAAIVCVLLATGNHLRFRKKKTPDQPPEPTALNGRGSA